MAKKKTKAASAASDPVPGELVGRTIARARRMSAAELDSEGWETGRHEAPIVLVLDDGTKLYASRDEEGNGPGALFGTAKDGSTFMVTAGSK